MLETISKFFYILADKKKKLLIVLLLSVLTSFLDAIGIGFVGPFVALANSPSFIHKSSWLNWIYTQSGFQSANQFILATGLLVICIFYAKSYLSFRVNHYIHEFSYSQEGELRSKLLHSYLTVPYTFHLNVNSAVLVHNIIYETHQFSNSVMLPALNVVSNGTILCFVLLLLLKTNLIATVVILGIQSFMFLVYHLARDKIARFGKEKSMSQKEMIRIINHSIGGLKETRIIGCKGTFENQMHEQSEIFTVAASSFSIFQFLPRVVLEPLLITFLIGLIAVSVTSHNTQNLILSLGIFTTAAIRLMPVVSSLLSDSSKIRNSNFSLNQLFFDLKQIEQLEVDHHPMSIGRDHLPVSRRSSEQVMSFVDQISLENVTYRYPKASETVLKDISLSLKKGESIALIGRSGAGKTTLVDVILGLLTPEGGDIRVDGKSVYNDLRSWQNLIGYIPQSIFLIDDTITRNIAFGVPDELIDSERLHKAIQAAHLTELIEELPDGVETVIGERGVRLSGGQRQRVGIARALYHEREILVLDEATAALDSETESRVTEAIQSLSGTKTMIIIAHRLTTVQHCDCVYLMDKGCIVKSGSYREVVLEKQAV